MKITGIVIALFFYVGHALAQEQDSTRIEIEINPNEPRPIVVPMQSQGFVVLDSSRDNIFDPVNIIKITKYDTAMQEGWKQTLEHNKRLSLHLFDFQKNNVYLLFGNEMREELNFIKINPETGNIDNYEFTYLKNFIMQDFLVLSGKIYVLGTLKRLPVLLEFDNQSKKVSPFPLAIDAKDTEVLDIYESSPSQISVTVAIKVNKRRQVLTKTFDVRTGSRSEFVIRPTQEYDMLNGKVTVLNDNDKLVVGTYGFRNRKESQGMYVGGYVKDKEVIKKYHSFTEMSNFFSFLSEKEQKRIEERRSKKATKGKGIRLRYRLLMHEAVKHDGKYVVVGEAYYPTYRTEEFRRFGARGYYYDTQRVFDGYKFTHAIIAAIDKRGDIAWDYSFKINDTKTFTLKERVRMAIQEDLIVMIYTIEGKIYQLKIKNGKPIDTPNTIQLKTKRKDDKVRISDAGQTEYWYDHFFLAWGYQRIKNNNDPLYANKRNVFYINKLKY